MSGNLPIFDVFQVLADEQPMFLADLGKKFDITNEREKKQTIKLKKYTAHDSRYEGIKKIAKAHMNKLIKNGIKRDLMKFINNNSLYSDDTETKLESLLKMCKKELRELVNEYERECDEYEDEDIKHTGTDRMPIREYEDMKICTIYLRYIVGYL